MSQRQFTTLANAVALGLGAAAPLLYSTHPIISVVCAAVSAGLLGSVNVRRPVDRP